MFITNILSKNKVYLSLRMSDLFTYYGSYIKFQNSVWNSVLEVEFNSLKTVT